MLIIGLNSWFLGTLEISWPFCNLPVYCSCTAWVLLVDCLCTARVLLVDCLSTAWWTAWVLLGGLLEYCLVYCSCPIGVLLVSYWCTGRVLLVYWCRFCLMTGYISLAFPCVPLLSMSVLAVFTFVASSVVIWLGRASESVKLKTVQSQRGWINSNTNIWCFRGFGCKGSNLDLVGWIKENLTGSV